VKEIIVILHQGDISNMEVEKKSSCLSTDYSTSPYCQRKDIGLDQV